MGGKNNCCLIDGCPIPPELELVGLTQISDWLELSNCCWTARFDYVVPVNNVRYTGPIYQSYEYNLKGRITYKGAIGSRNSSGECVYTSQQNVGYKEGWTYAGEQWRKFAVYSINPSVYVYAHRVVVTEFDLPVAYWYYRIDQQYAGTRGWERKTSAFLVSTIYVAEGCGEWFNAAGGTPPSAHPSEPIHGVREPTDWTETEFINFTTSSKTYFKVKESDLAALPTENWLELEASTEDTDLTPSSSCTPGVQTPGVLVYSRSPFVPCEEIVLNIVSLGGPSCNTQIRGGLGALFLNGAQIGAYNFNFQFLLSLNDCCIDLDSACSWDIGFWWWDHEARIDINNCEESFNPYDIVLHGVFDVRVRFPE